MNKRKNSIEKGFLRTYRQSTENILFVPLDTGFLKLEYGAHTQNLLSKISFVAQKSKNAKTIGNYIDLNLGGDAGEQGTYMEEESVSGVQWSNGHSGWGHTYQNGTPSESREISLEDWVDEMIDNMINPPEELLKTVTEKFDLINHIEEIRSGNSEVRECFWNTYYPETIQDVELVLSLIEEGIKNNDSDLIFTCSDPLKRSVTGSDSIIKKLKSLLAQYTTLKELDRLVIEGIVSSLS